MGKCARCDLARIYKAFEDKKARQAAAKRAEATPQPVITEEPKAEEPVIEKAPAKRVKKKVVVEPIAEGAVIEEPAIIAEEQSEEE